MGETEVKTTTGNYLVYFSYGYDYTDAPKEDRFIYSEVERVFDEEGTEVNMNDLPLMVQSKIVSTIDSAAESSLKD